MVQVSKVDEDGRPLIVISEGYIVRLEIDDMDERTQERALTELRETPENVEKGLKELRQLLQGKVAQV